MRLVGSICALVTPFARDGALDEAALAGLIDWQIAAGTDGLVIAGSTGEAAMLDDDEYRHLLTLAVDAVAGRVPVLAGTGAAGTEKAVRQTRLAAACGIDAALVVTPWYVRPTQEGLRRHYLEIVDRTEIPIVLYNVPSRTGCDLEPSTVAALCGHKRIVGIKEAVPAADRMAALLALRGDGFAVLGGDDGTACAAMLAGADGVVSVAANVAPGPFARLCDHARAGDAGAAHALDRAMRPLYEFLGVEPNPIPAKWLLHRQGRIQPGPRLPLTPLSPAWHGPADTVLAGLPELPGPPAA